MNMRISLRVVGLLALAGIVACRTPVKTTTPDPLSHKLSAEEDGIRDLIPNTKLPLTIGSGDVLWRGIVERNPLMVEWGKFLSERAQNAEMENEILLRLERRYRETFTAHNQVIEDCKPKPETYDGSWIKALHVRFGDAVRANAKMLRSALLLAERRAERECQKETRTALLLAELEYQAAVENRLRNWTEFVNSTPALSVAQRNALIQRANIVATLQHKVSVAWIILDGYEVGRLEVEAEALPSDLFKALIQQRTLSKPFSFTRALDDLNRELH